MSNFKSTKTDGSESLFGEVIFSYTRAQAIEGGVLIDWPNGIASLLISTNLVENIGSHPRRQVSPVSALNAALSQPSKSLKPWASVATSANGSTCSRLEENDAQKTRATSSGFANHLGRLFIIAYGDEGAMPQVSGIRPFDECDLADQLRFRSRALPSSMNAAARADDRHAI
jgi:hypothetical protein